MTQSAGRLRIPLLGLALVVCAGWLSVRVLEPPAVRTDTAIGEFSTERALAMLGRFSSTMHPVGTVAHDRVRDEVVAAFREIGLEPTIQRAVVAHPRRTQVCFVENVLARLPGRRPGKAVALVTHYDSTAASFGAADAGAGVVALVEVGRVLRAGAQLEHDVLFLITDGEEYGLYGAQAFVGQDPQARDIAVVVNLEARGSSGPSLMFETGAGNSTLIELLAATVANPRATSLAYEIYRLMPNDTDFTVFKKAGVPGLNFAFIGSPWTYHTPLDNLASLDRRSLQHHGEQTLALARRFGSELPPAAVGNAVYFNVGPWLVHYRDRWLVPIHLVLLALCATTLVLARRCAALEWPSLGKAIGVLLLAVVLAAVGAAASFWLIGQAHLRLAGGREGALQSNGYYLLAVCAFAVLAATVATRRWRQQMGVLQLGAAAMSVWTVLALASALTLPGASYLFTWPALVMTTGLLALVWLRSTSPVTFAVVGTASAFTGAVLLVPVLSLLGVALGLTVTTAAVIGVVAALLWMTSLPLIGEAERDAAPVVPAMVATTVVAALVAGLWWSSARFPQATFSMLRYVLDANRGTAFWFTPKELRTAWSDGVMGTIKPGHPHVEGAWASAYYVHADAPVVKLAAPTLSASVDRTEGQRRTLELAAAWSGRPFRLSISSKAVRLLGAQVGGTQVTAPGPQEEAGFAIGVMAPPAGALNVTLTVERRTEPLELVIAADYPGLPTELGSVVPERPAGVLPTGGGDTTHVRKSFTFAAPQ
jgi:hypothetical protein